MTPVLDPFMAGVKPQGLQRGRGGFLRSADDAPYVSDPSGEVCKTGDRKGEVKRVKYGSPSNRGREIENDAALVKYRQRLSFLGIGMDTALAEACRDLALMDADSDEFKHAADKIAVEADKLTRSWQAADRGTHGHLLCELCDLAVEPNDVQVDAGEAVGLDIDTQIGVTQAWRYMLKDNGLEILAIEASCVDDKWRLAGTTDRFVRATKPLTFAKSTGELVTIPANTVLDGDLKFGKVRQAHAIQIASYAQSVPYDTETETRGEWPWEISQEHALIFHGDFGDDVRPPSFELVYVDLVAGREHGGQCVVDAKAWAARDDVFSVAQIATGDNVSTSTSGPSGLDGASDRRLLGGNRPVSATGKRQEYGATGLSRGALPLVGVDRVAAEAAQLPIELFGTELYDDSDDPCLDGTCPSCWDDESSSVEETPIAAEPLGPSTDETLPPGSAVAGIVEQGLDFLAVNDLLPRQGMPQHALDELEVDRLNDQRRQSYDTSTLIVERATDSPSLDATIGHGYRPIDTGGVAPSAWPLADPTRLALVDARAALCDSPDEGADWSSDEFAPLWDELRGLFDGLGVFARSWRAGLASDAKKRHVDFLAQGGMTERRYWINKAVICMALAYDEPFWSDPPEVTDILRELLAHIIGDVALMLGVEPGHALGSLGAAEAARFAAHVDAYLSVPDGAA